MRGITLSPAQLAVGEQKMRARGLDGQVSLELCDYRDVEGQYDRVVSIEMFEAVGEAYWRGYFDKLRQVLKPEGRAVLQVITIANDRFEHYPHAPRHDPDHGVSRRHAAEQGDLRRRWQPRRASR